MICFRCPRCRKTKDALDFWWSETEHVCKDCAEKRVVERRAVHWEKMANKMFGRTINPEWEKAGPGRDVGFVAEGIPMMSRREYEVRTARDEYLEAWERFAECPSWSVVEILWWNWRVGVTYRRMVGVVQGR